MTHNICEDREKTYIEEFLIYKMDWKTYKIISQQIKYLTDLRSWSNGSGTTEYQLISKLLKKTELRKLQQQNISSSVNQSSAQVH